MTTDDLVTWLRGVLDDEERMALDARGDQPTETGVWTLVDNREHQAGAHIKVVDPLGYEVTENWDVCSRPWDTLPHIARHDPAQVLREVEAKRRILADIHEATCVSGATWLLADRIMRLLALPYADRRGFKEEWRA